MISTDEELERLDDLLCGLPAAEAMTLEELDGYVGALIVCPEIIPPSEWLPGVWGGEGVFANADEANEIIGAVMGHYNRVAQVLADDPESYVPLLDIDPHCDEVLWELWVGGFERGMRLRADAWVEIVESDDEEAAASVTMLLTLNECSEGRSDLKEGSINELCGLAPALLLDCLRNLNVWTKSRGDKGRGMDGGKSSDLLDLPFDFGDRRTFGRKVGRNEPCPCGSGRKYKRCCGAN